MLTSVESKQHPTHSPHCYSLSSSPQKQKSSKFNLKIKSWETKMIGITQHHDHHHHRRPSSQSQTVAKVRLRFSFIKGCIADTAVFICTIHHTTCMNYGAWYISQEKNSSEIIADKDYIAKSKKKEFYSYFCLLPYFYWTVCLSISFCSVRQCILFYCTHSPFSTVAFIFFFTDNATFSPFSTILHCTLYYQNKFWERRALKDDETTAATVFSTI